MPLPKFDPWSTISNTDRSVNRAYRAYPDRPLGTISTISTSMRPEIDTFEERAAVLEFDFGLQRDRARNSAALVSGFKSVKSLHEKAISRWRQLIIAAREKTRCDRLLCERALAFCEGPWVARCVALGWDETSLFAVAPENRTNGGLVQAVAAGHIRAVTEEAAYYANVSGGHAKRFGRFDNDLGQVQLIWEND